MCVFMCVCVCVCVKNSMDLSSNLTQIHPLTSALSEASGLCSASSVGSNSASDLVCDTEICSPASAKHFVGKPCLLADLTPATRLMRVVAIGSSQDVQIGQEGVITLLQPTSQLFVKWDLTGMNQLTDRQKLVPEHKCPAGLVRFENHIYLSLMGYVASDFGGRGHCGGV